MVFLYHTPAIDKVEAANDFTLTDAINQIITFSSVSPADLIDNFLDPTDLGPLLSDCLRVYLLEQFVRETCLVEETFGEPLVDISKFSGLEFLVYCPRGRHKKTEGYKNYESKFEEAAEAYIKKKIQQFRPNAGPKEVLSVPNPMAGPTTFYTRALSMDDHSHSHHSSQDTTLAKQPVRTPAGHDPSVQNDGNTQPATPKPVDTAHPLSPHQFAAAFEAIHRSTGDGRPTTSSTKCQAFVQKQ